MTDEMMSYAAWGVVIATWIICIAGSAVLLRFNRKGR